MKIIKKITAMMLSIMMVLGMCSVVNAEGTTEKGTITINNAISGQTYKIYKILELESYAPNKDASGNDTGLYSYKPASTAWKTFFETDGAAYVNINENGYVTWKTDVTNDKAAELSQKALAYAGTNNISVTKESPAAEGSTSVEFTGLELGYYLVDSSAGALCGLTTTNPTVTIEEKNGKPTVDKKINLDGNANFNSLGEKNSVNIGDVVTFQTTINVHPGAKNYILHDVMDTNLQFIDLQEVVPVENNDEQRELDRNTYYNLINSPTDGCTFELKFTDKFYTEYADKITNNILTKIQVRYHAMVNEDAPINTAMKNTAWLTYGDNNTESNKSETETYTYGIPVYKYTMKDGAKSGLAGAKFSLYTDNNNAVGTIINFKKTENEYRYTKENVDTAGTTTTLQSPEDGNFNINGLKAGTYWLKETEAPKGYNKLAEPIKIIIEQDTDGAKIMKNVKGDTITKVEVENKSGSILPSTGGIGTTIFYIAGAFLVLISGVVLIAKKRTDSK